MTTATRDMRADARIAVTRRGRLSDGREAFPCVVLDMSSGGFLMVCNRPLPVGTTLDFRCQLYPNEFLDCKIEVMHGDGDSIGTMITQIDNRTARVFEAYLEEKYLERMTKVRKPHPEEAEG